MFKMGTELLLLTGMRGGAKIVDIANLGKFVLDDQGNLYQYDKTRTPTEEYILVEIAPGQGEKPKF